MVARGALDAEIGVQIPAPQPLRFAEFTLLTQGYSHDSESKVLSDGERSRTRVERTIFAHSL